jgi:hypothetical protein
MRKVSIIMATTIDGTTLTLLQTWQCDPIFAEGVAIALTRTVGPPKEEILNEEKPPYSH